MSNEMNASVESVESVETVETSPVLTGEAATAWIKHNRTTVKSVAGPVNADLIEAMKAVPETKVSAMKGRITKAVNLRRDHETKDGAELSKDFRHVESWNRSDAVARLFVALEIDPQAYLMLVTLSDEEIEKRGFHPDAKTRNLKAYKKVVEVAEYIANGPESHLEAVFKTFVACSLIATRELKVIPRDVCTDFLSSAELRNVSPDLREAIADFQAKQMSGGAPTQTSQMVLTLANLKCGTVVRDGRTKHFALSHDSQVVRALAARFGMSDLIKQSA